MPPEGVGNAGAPHLTHESAWQEAVEQAVSDVSRARRGQTTGKVLQGTGFVIEKAADEVPHPGLRQGIKATGIAIGVHGERMETNAIAREGCIRESRPPNECEAGIVEARY